MAPTKKRSAFMEFAMDWKAKQIKKNKNYDINQAIKNAGRIWEQMTDQEKSIYKERALTNGPLQPKDEDTKNKKPNEKLNSFGVPVSEVDTKEFSGLVKKRRIKQEIEEIVEESQNVGDFKEKKYYFISANYFVKTETTNNYIPAEIALTEFSLDEGIINKFHSYINPGDVLFGKFFQAKEHSENTHRLPLPPDAKGERDLGKLYLEIMKFLSPITKGLKFQPPPLFTTTKCVQIVQNIMNFLQQDCFEDDVPESVQVFPMEYLFFTLKTTAADIAKINPPISIYITDMIFEKDKYDYKDGISCDFHEEIDRGKYCALSCCTRWVYTFAENLCLDLAISLKPGFHIPSDIESAIKYETDR